MGEKTTSLTSSSHLGFWESKPCLLHQAQHQPQDHQPLLGCFHTSIPTPLPLLFHFRAALMPQFAPSPHFGTLLHPHVCINQGSPQLLLTSTKGERAMLNIQRVSRIWQEDSTATTFNAEGFSKHSPFCSAVAATERGKNSAHLSLTLVLHLSLAATPSIPACTVLPLSRLTLFWDFFLAPFLSFPDQKSKLFCSEGVDAAAAEKEALQLPAHIPALCHCSKTSREQAGLTKFGCICRKTISPNQCLSGSAKTFIREGEKPNEFVRR